MNILILLRFFLLLIIRLGRKNDLTGLENAPLMSLDVQRSTKQNRQNTENLKNKKLKFFVQFLKNKILPSNQSSYACRAREIRPRPRRYKHPWPIGFEWRGFRPHTQ